MTQQAAKTIMMVRPKHFGFDHESAISNPFQNEDGAGEKTSIQNLALSEFDVAVKLLREAGLLQCEKVGVTHMNSIRSDELNAKFPNLLETVISLIPDIPKD